MALVITSLCRIAQAPYGTAGAMAQMFMHATPDAAATVVAAGYYNDARHKLWVGDLILCSAGIGGAPATLLLRVTAAPSAGNVTVAGGTVTTT